MSYGVLIDLRGIQEYIFSSNRLKDNIGASYLVSHFFDGIDDTKVKQKVDGGGNLFCVVDSEENAKELIRELSEKVLTEMPGLTFSAIYIECDPNDKKIEPFWKELQEEKQKRNQVSIVPSFGINSQCSATALAAEYRSEDGNLSGVVKAKRDSAEKGNIKNEEDFGDVLENQFDFAYEFSDLVLQKGIESNIAIVHIDGNDMGELFSGCKDLIDYENLSKNVNKTNVEAFRNMLVFAVDKILRKDWKYYKKYLTKSKNGKKHLPIRPIFIGGDDVTFVCEGRLGIPLAIEFIEQIDKLSDKKYNCCAGIAVVNEKYPFYQGVQMAQSLCSQAKKKRIKNKNKSGDKAYIDFQLINSSTCDPIEEIRKQYKREDEDLYEKPYNLEELKEQLKHAELLRKWPRSKVKELRDVIFKNKEAIDAFDLQIQARGDLEYPILGDKNKLYPVSHKYPDIIELMELIPDGGE